MKQYQGEKAIISLTSWKARIKTVGLTIYSLLTQCPGFHIVLCLSKAEFPFGQSELPYDLNLLSETNQIEILWVHANTGPFKKVMYTMYKYPSTPIISCDDGQIYTCNMAEILYYHYIKNYKSAPLIVSWTHLQHSGIDHGVGCRGLLYSPYCFNIYGLKYMTDKIVKTKHDDAYIGVLAKKLHIKWVFIGKLNERRNNFIVLPADEQVGLTKTKSYDEIASFNIIKRELGV